MPDPASVPISIRGNYFYRAEERFLVKGICYNFPVAKGDRPADGYTNLDPLTPERLSELEQDIPLLQELGLNSISVSGLDPDVNHSPALRLLEEAGFYVCVNLPSQDAPTTEAKPPPPFDTASLYCDSAHTLKQTLRLATHLTPHPNILALAVPSPSSHTSQHTELAELTLATIRDLKALPLPRKIPIGVTASSDMMTRLPALHYFTNSTTVADFFAHESWEWAGKSSFQISGYANLVASNTRVAPTTPLLFAEYGTNISRPRVWEEVLCLFSPDMTGSYSGGFAWTFHEYAGSRYGVVDIVQREGRPVRRKREQEFNSLRNKFRVVNGRARDEVAVAEVREGEEWVGEAPEVRDGTWLATSELPPCPLDLEQVAQELRAGLATSGADDGGEPDQMDPVRSEGLQEVEGGIRDLDLNSRDGGSV